MRPPVFPSPWRAFPAGPLMATVALGGAYAYHDGLPLRAAPLLLCLLAVLAAQIGLGGLMSLLDPEAAPLPAPPDEGAGAAVVVLACVAAFGLGLSAAVMSQPLVFLAGAVGALAAVALVLPVLPVAYLGNGVGEVVLLVLAGPVPTVAAYASQGGGLHAGVLAASAPAGLFSIGIVLLSQRGSADTDSVADRPTLAVIAGPSVARWLPWGAFTLAYSSLAAVVLWGEFPHAALAGLATIPATAWVLANGERDRSRDGRFRDARRMGWIATLTLSVIAAAMFGQRW